MNIITSRKMERGVFHIMGAALLAVFLGSCNENMQGTLRTDYIESGSMSRSGHVLFITVDGMSGTAVQAARNAYKAPNLKAMASTAIYTDYGMADQSRFAIGDSMSNERGWANLMLGNTKHGIFTAHELDSVPKTSFVDRLLSVGKSVRMFVSDETFYHNFVPSSLESKLYDDDIHVKDALINTLKENSEPSDLLLAQFKSVYEVGLNRGFYKEDNTPTVDIMDQVKVVDGYIGEIYAALQERPNYKNENWLVIISSNYGGNHAVDHDQTSLYNDRSRNAFILMGNENMVAGAQGKPSESSVNYNFYTPVWAYDYRNQNPTTYAESARLRDVSVGNIIINKENNLPKPMTISFFLKSSQSTSAKYVMLSKSADYTDNGWGIYMNDGNKSICFQIGNKRDIVKDLDYSSWNWKEWHAITVTIEPDSIKRTTRFTLYVDGEAHGTASHDNKKMVRSKYYSNGKKGNPDEVPFRIGSTENKSSQNSHKQTKNCKATNTICITNIQLYNVAMPAVDVRKYSGTTMLHKLGDSYPYWDNLVGYWPCDLMEDEGVAILKDYSQYRKEDGSTDFVIDRGAIDVWESGVASDAGIHPILESDPTFYNNTFNTVDVAREIFLWLGQPISFDWNFEGLAWKLPYDSTSNTELVK